MIDVAQLKHLRNLLHGQTLLYVEDNTGLNTQATTVFKKIFDTVISAKDGEEGLSFFKQYSPSIVITDIKMPKKDGMQMAKEILSLNPDATIIFTTAYNETDLLHDAIRLGAFDYLVKPITIDNIIEVLERYGDSFHEQMHHRLFTQYLQNIFNYQQNLVLLLRQDTIVMANQPCLDFFGEKNIESFKQRFEVLGDLLLEHKGFLYNHDEIDWLEEVKKHPGKLFNVKIADNNSNSHHFILTLQTIPDKEDYFILSLNDVTELNLLKLFDANAVEKEALVKDQKALLGLFEMAKRNNAKIQIYNLYKGLSITNEGMITEIDEKFITISTTFMQLKAIQFEKRIVLISDIFPLVIESAIIERINFDEQYVRIGACKMSTNSPTRRQYIRVPVVEKSQATLFYQDRRFDTDISIADISIKATRLILASLPAGLAVDTEVTLDIVLETPQRPFIIHSPAKVFRIAEQSRHYEVVFMYDLHDPLYSQLIDYIANQQMNLIREFKAMQFG